jgi:hypothetical protein
LKQFFPRPGIQKIFSFLIEGLQDEKKFFGKPLAFGQIQLNLLAVWHRILKKETLLPM